MEIKQDDLFFTAKKDKIPLGYIPINMITLDKLSPSVLHFRNYSMEELLEIASATDELKFETLVLKGFNNMIYEDFDCSTLHVENIKQIIQTIYLNFWGTTLLSKPFFKDLNGDLDSVDNIDYTDIDLRTLTFKQIDKSFKNPFTLTDSITGSKIKVILPTVGHSFIASKKIKEMFKDEDDSFRTIEINLEAIEKMRSNGVEDKDIPISVLSSDRENYDKHIDRKNLEYLKLMQAQLLFSIDGKELSFEEKVENYKTIDATFWKEYANVVKEKAQFGLDDEYSFAYNGEKISRRFSFRPLEFIPSLEQKTNTRYIVSFDD